MNPINSAHTQHIKRSWREVRTIIPTSGRHPDHMAEYLADFLFRRVHPNPATPLHDLFQTFSTVRSTPSQ